MINSAVIRVQNMADTDSRADADTISQLPLPARMEVAIYKQVPFSGAAATTCAGVVISSHKGSINDCTAPGYITASSNISLSTVPIMSIQVPHRHQLNWYLCCELA